MYNFRSQDGQPRTMTRCRSRWASSVDLLKPFPPRPICITASRMHRPISSTSKQSTRVRKSFLDTCRKVYYKDVGHKANTKSNQNGFRDICHSPEDSKRPCACGASEMGVASRCKISRENFYQRTAMSIGLLIATSGSMRGIECNAIILLAMGLS